MGRSRRSDIQLTAGSVSRRHAELTITDDGRVFVADCASKYGTYVRSGRQWRRIRQDFAEAGDVLRLGDYEIGVRELLTKLPSPSQPNVVDRADDRPAGPVSRDPRTGAVRAKT